MSRGWLQETQPVEVEVGGERVTLGLPHAGATEGWCGWKGSRRPFVLARDGDEVHVWVDGAAFVFRRMEPVRRGRRAAQADGEAGRVVATMPGKVLRVMVAQGELVEAEQPVAALESMKMEHVLKSPGAGVVKAVRVKPGDRVVKGAVLVEVEAPQSLRQAQGRL